LRSGRKRLTGEMRPVPELRRKYQLELESFSFNPPYTIYSPLP
jgi:hypothetical protein